MSCAGRRSSTSPSSHSSAYLGAVGMISKPSGVSVHSISCQCLILLDVDWALVRLCVLASPIPEPWGPGVRYRQSPLDPALENRRGLAHAPLPVSFSMVARYQSPVQCCASTGSPGWNDGPASRARLLRMIRDGERRTGRCRGGGTRPMSLRARNYSYRVRHYLRPASKAGSSRDRWRRCGAPRRTRERGAWAPPEERSVPPRSVLLGRSAASASDLVSPWARAGLGASPPFETNTIIMMISTLQQQY